ncbi:MAG: DUF2764 family protein [Candidatus Omnitrophica bacterium]|nr:DUF2764 family protein [Candidatus Omnitrophota bacterium]
MPNRYYFLVSSLVHLTFGKEAPITRERFLSECRKWLTEKDLLGIYGASTKVPEKSTCNNGLLSEWESFDIDLRKILSEAREARKHAYDRVISPTAEDILDSETPLDIENRFEKIRWEFLEEKAFDHHFDKDWLTAYFLKIQILERLAMFKKEEGQRIFAEVCEVRDE